MRLNSVKELQKQLLRTRGRSTSHRSAASTKTLKPLQGSLCVLQYVLSICLAALNYPLAGHNSLKDVSATGKEDVK